MAPRNGSGRWIRAATRLAIYIRDGFTCLYCGAKFNKRGFNLTLDHVVPHVKGGSNKPTNLITACRSCNSARQSKSVAKFATVAARKRIRNARRRKLTRYRVLARKLVEKEE